MIDQPQMCQHEDQQDHLNAQEYKHYEGQMIQQNYYEDYEYDFYDDYYQYSQPFQEVKYNKDPQIKEEQEKQINQIKQEDIKLQKVEDIMLQEVDEANEFYLAQISRIYVQQTNNVCKICCIQYHKQDLDYFGQCFHKFCIQCIKNHAEEGIKKFKVVTCLEQGCKQRLQNNSPYIQMLSKQQKQKYYKILVYDNLDRKSSIKLIKLCTQENCEGFIDLSTNSPQCVLCGTNHCISCMNQQSYCSCMQQNSLEEHLQSKYRFKKCSNCKMMVERKQGCKHITCRCGYQFCYICGDEWKRGHKCANNQVDEYQNRPLFSRNGL